MQASWHLGNPLRRLSRKVGCEYLPDDFGLMVDDDEVPARPEVAVDEAVLGDSLLELLSDRPLGVVRDRARLLLCKGGEEGEHQLSIGGHGVDVLALEAHADAEGPEFPET